MALLSLNAWDEAQGSGKRCGSFTKTMRSPKEDFSDVLQKLTSAINRTVSDLGVRKNDNCNFWLLNILIKNAKH